jgi:hypothetical protein
MHPEEADRGTRPASHVREQRCLVLAALLACGLAQPPAPAHDGWKTQPATARAAPNAQPGPHIPGFQYVVVFDAERPYRRRSEDAAGPRPIAIGVWYPATAGGPRLTAGDYAGYPAAPERPEPSPEERRAARADAAAPWTDAGASREAVGRASARPLRGVRNARPAAGRFPLVLFAHASIFGASVMAEFLASHGFVVAAVPSKDATAGPYRLSVASIHAMARDLETALARLRPEPFVRRERPSVIGMSNGALGAAVLETRIGALAAFVSLDGTIGERGASGNAARLFGAAPPDLSFETPLVHLFTPANPHLDLSLLSGGVWSAACAAAAFPGMRHLDFLAYPILAAGVEGLDALQPASAVRDSTRVMELSLAFLERWARPTGPEPSSGSGLADGLTRCANLAR